MKSWFKVAAAVTLLSTLPLVAGFGPEDKKTTVQVDAALKDYTPVQGISGTIKSIGSDTLNNLMTHWTELFNKYYPAVRVEVEGKGSSTAPPALTAGQSQFGPMSREMKSAEIDEFEKKWGYKPTALRVAVDSLAIYVHKDCPLDEISMENAMKVFSVAGPEMTWGDLGLTTAEYKNKPVSLYGRNSASGTYGFFKELVLEKKDFKNAVKEQPGSSAVVQGVANDKFGMGYSGIGYKTADVKALRVIPKGGKTGVAATADNAYSGEYPIARFLYVYINNDPKKALDPLRAEFVKVIYSKQGQESVIKDGYFPVTAEIAREDLTVLGIKPNF
jgi:phosphate transport system substrate-binding protein